jgi:hypothetical protein
MAEQAESKQLPEQLDIPLELERREQRLAAIAAAKAEIEARAQAANAHRLSARAGKAIYAKRKSTVETVFRIIKHVHGFRQFSLRGLRAVQDEWALVCIGWNLKRLFALQK